jgi:hypothetical protein
MQVGIPSGYQTPGEKTPSDLEDSATSPVGNGGGEDDCAEDGASWYTALG